MAKRFSEEFAKEITDLYAAGLSAKEIEKKYNCSSASVINWAHRLGVHVQSSREKRPRVVPDGKACRICKLEKKINDFYKNPENVDGHAGWCKECENIRRTAKDPEWREKMRVGQREAHREHPHKIRDRSLRNRFHMTLEDFEQRLRDQGGVCLGCKRQPSPEEVKGFWHVDHDHACCDTEKTCGLCVRGILCRNCNSLLGLAKDNPQTLGRLIVYLRQSQATS